MEERRREERKCKCLFFSTNTPLPDCDTLTLVLILTFLAWGFSFFFFNVLLKRSQSTDSEQSQTLRRWINLDSSEQKMLIMACSFRLFWASWCLLPTIISQLILDVPFQKWGKKHTRVIFTAASTASRVIKSRVCPPPPLFLFPLKCDWQGVEVIDSCADGADRGTRNACDMCYFSISLLHPSLSLAMCH